MKEEDDALSSEPPAKKVAFFEYANSPKMTTCPVARSEPGRAVASASAGTHQPGSQSRRLGKGLHCSTQHCSTTSHADSVRRCSRRKRCEPLHRPLKSTRIERLVGNGKFQHRTLPPHSPRAQSRADGRHEAVASSASVDSLDVGESAATRAHTEDGRTTAEGR